MLTYGIPGTPAYLLPDPTRKDRHWERHQVLDAVDNESPTLRTLPATAIICNFGGNFGFASRTEEVTAKWPFAGFLAAAIGSASHGLGLGDVNGDGRLDFLYKDGWWEPKSRLGITGAPSRRDSALAALLKCAYDVNGDGLNDVITAIAAGYGLWHETPRKGRERPSAIQGPRFHEQGTEREPLRSRLHNFTPSN